MAHLLNLLVNLYVFAIIGRIILSYFPIRPGSPVAPVFAFLYSITEPVLGPVRRVVPALGMFDISPMVVLFALWYVVTPLINKLPA